MKNSSDFDGVLEKSFQLIFQCETSVGKARESCLDFVSARPE